MISMDSPSREIRQQRERIKAIKGGFEKAMKRASTRVASQGRTGISKSIRQGMLIKAAEVNKLIHVKKYKAGASVALRQSDRISLRHFGAMQDEVGVSYQIAKGGKRRYIDDAFMGPKYGQLAPKLHGNVFKRAGKSRLPIVKIMGPSPWGVFLRKKMYQSTKDDLSQKFHDRLRHEIDFLIEKARSRNA
jgi:hypothetical protein